MEVNLKSYTGLGRTAVLAIASIEPLGNKTPWKQDNTISSGILTQRCMLLICSFMASGHLILDRASTSVLDLPGLYDKEKWKEARPAIHLCVVASYLALVRI